ncbi:GGDEF domain-containing protein [Prosthecomicrobium sp. N25]|uniref:GGDEF domain-containing protein n=1 Tax=Prosthecomicrobium sp. N25 TaxID=3129254 RepID=UPI003077C4FD
MKDPRREDAPSDEGGGEIRRSAGHGVGTGGEDGLRRRIRELEVELARRSARIAELETMVHEDDLTGLLNRRGLLAEIARVIDFGRRYGAAAGLAFVDLDSFKTVNDRYGHAVGDGLLTEAGRRIRSVIRSSDAAGRIGGDEFLVVLRQVDPEGLRRKAESLRTALEAAPVVVDGVPVEIRASVGIAAFEPEDTAESAILRADRDMFRDKRERQGVPGDDPLRR